MRPKWDAQSQGLKAEMSVAQGQGLAMGVDDRSDGDSAEGRETGPDPPCLCVQA